VAVSCSSSPRRHRTRPGSKPTWILWDFLALSTKPSTIRRVSPPRSSPFTSKAPNQAQTPRRVLRGSRRAQSELPPQRAFPVLSRTEPGA
jgi:hypothetical protein